MTNELPKLNDVSGALASRFIVFVLTKSFYGQEDPTLTEQLLAEAPSIFLWALEGLDRVLKRGHLINPASGADAVQQLEDLSSPISAFLRDRCVRDPNMSVAVEELWSQWKEWCGENNARTGTKAMLGRDLRAAMPTIRMSRPRKDEDRVYFYDGLGLRS